MKLLTKANIKLLEEQYSMGSSLDQKVVVKLFNPVGSWTWYLMNIDPNDHSYAWGIVNGIAVEMGSINLAELESVRLPMGLSIERDRYFKPMPAKEVWARLNEGEHI